MLFARWMVSIVKNWPRSWKCCWRPPRGHSFLLYRPTFSRQITISAYKWVYTTLSLNWLTCHLQTIAKSLKWPSHGKLNWQTCVGKLKLMCVKDTRKVGKHFGKLLVTNRTCLSSCQLFRVGKLISYVWTIGKRVCNFQPIKTHALFRWFWVICNDT